MPNVRLAYSKSSRQEVLIFLKSEIYFMRDNIFSLALKLTLPIFFGYVAIGIPFGLMLVNAGYPWWISLVMGIFMYTGAGQYFAIGLFAGGASLALIVLSQFLLSIRHFFYALALIEKYKGTGFYKPYLIYSITDETFAVISNINVPKNVNKSRLYFLISLFDQFYWLLGSVIGALSYKLLEKYNLSQYLQGVDFALTALFIVILIEQIKVTKDFLSPAVGVLCAIVVVILYKLGFLSSSNILWIAILLGLLLLLLVRGPKFFRESKETSNGLNS